MVKVAVREKFRCTSQDLSQTERSEKVITIMWHAAHDLQVVGGVLLKK